MDAMLPNVHHFNAVDPDISCVVKRKCSGRCAFPGFCLSSLLCFNTLSLHQLLCLQGDEGHKPCACLFCDAAFWLDAEQFSSDAVQFRSVLTYPRSNESPSSLRRHLVEGRPRYRYMCQQPCSKQAKQETALNNKTISPFSCALHWEATSVLSITHSHSVPPSGRGSGRGGGEGERLQSGKGGGYVKGP